MLRMSGRRPKERSTLRPWVRGCSKVVSPAAAVNADLQQWICVLTAQRRWRECQMRILRVWRMVPATL